MAAPLHGPRRDRRDQAGPRGEGSDGQLPDAHRQLLDGRVGGAAEAADGILARQVGRVDDRGDRGGRAVLQRRGCGGQRNRSSADQHQPATAVRESCRVMYDISVLSHVRVPSGPLFDALDPVPGHPLWQQRRW